jgi:hypothetical protein
MKRASVHSLGGELCILPGHISYPGTVREHQKNAGDFLFFEMSLFRREAVQQSRIWWRNSIVQGNERLIVIAAREISCDWTRRFITLRKARHLGRECAQSNSHLHTKFFCHRRTVKYYEVICAYRLLFSPEVLLLCIFFVLGSPTFPSLI